MTNLQPTAAVEEGLVEELADPSGGEITNPTSKRLSRRQLLVRRFLRNKVAVAGLIRSLVVVAAELRREPIGRVVTLLVVAHVSRPRSVRSIAA